jgi:hypothetical protein
MSDTLPMARTQPVPEKCLAVRHRTPEGEWVTAVYRRFAPGEADRCRLCPRGECSAVNDECLVGVDGHVPRGEAKMLATRPPAPGRCGAASGLDLAVRNGPLNGPR